MKKKILSIMLLCAIAFATTACSSGVSKSEYNKVVKERDDYKAQLEALTGQSQDDASSEKESKNEFSVGETWEVSGLFKMTVDSVEQSDQRNEFEETNPGAVYIITYTYENIGINEDLYVDMESKIVDSAGKMGTSYPGDKELYPQSVPIGAHCQAQACIAVENPGNFKDYVSIYDDDYNEYNAIFNLGVE